MWAGISGLITLAVMVLKLWVDNKTASEAKFNEDKKRISDAVASGDLSAINSVIDRMRN